MSLQKQLMHLFIQDENNIYLGVNVLAAKLKAKSASVMMALNNKNLEEWKAKRPKVTPANWNEPYPFDTAKWNQYRQQETLRKQKARFEGMSETVYPAPFGPCVVFGSENEHAIAHLSNGLGHRHEHNLRLLDRFERVVTQQEDGTYVITARDGINFCSTRFSYLRDYRNYRKFIEELEQYETA